MYLTIRLYKLPRCFLRYAQPYQLPGPFLQPYPNQFHSHSPGVASPSTFHHPSLLQSSSSSFSLVIISLHAQLDLLQA